MMNQSEKELIDGLLTRNEAAFRMFYETYAPRVKGFVAKQVSQEKDCEEIVQDTLFAFLDRVRDFTGRSKLNTYLCAIARNKVIDYYRRKKLKQVVFSQLPEGMLELFAHHKTPEKELDQIVLKEKIMQVLSGLAPIHSRLLLLKYRDGMAVDEIAHKLSCSFKSAESHLFRARQAFIKSFDG